MVESEETTQESTGGVKGMPRFAQTPAFKAACAAGAVLLVAFCAWLFFAFPTWQSATASEAARSDASLVESGITQGQLKAQDVPQHYTYKQQQNATVEQAEPYDALATKQATKAKDPAAKPMEAEAEAEAEAAETPPPFGELVDFAALQAQYPDAFAWIRIPNTNIDYPVMQHETEDDFYLEHLPDGTPSFIGSVYAHPVASQKLDDPVTLFYGHTLPAYDQVFTELHKFQDDEFFAENEKFYVFLPDNRVLGYQVVAQYEYDDRLITSSFDLADEQVRAEYYDYILHPTDAISTVREGATLDATQDQILQLSTCTDPDIFTKRYIVTGKLVEIWDAEK